MSAAVADPGKNPPPRTRARGRPRVIDREAIIAAAREIGLDQLSMPTLARKLNVKYPSLYWHVGGRQEIVLAVIDAAFDEVEWPAPCDDWKAYVRAFSSRYAAALADTPGIAAALGANRRLPDGPMRALNELRTALLDYGFDPADALLFAHMVTHQLRHDFDFARSEGGSTMTFDDARAELAARVDDASRGADPRLREPLREWLQADGEAHFSQRLDLLIDGFETRLHPKR